MTQSHHTEHTNEGPGHHWREADRVRQYVDRMDQRAEERAQQFALLARLLPFEQDEAFEVLDLGAGYGVVAAAVLSAYPKARATLLDVSEPMIELGKERMAPFDGRYAYVHGNFDNGTLPDEVARPFGAAVSSLAIHHLPPEAKRTLYRTIAMHLTPGGCFLDLDSVAAPDHETEAVYQRASERAAARPEPEQPGIPDRYHHSEMQPLEHHLAWLREAGLVHVDCYWKRLDMALFGGFRPQG